MFRYLCPQRFATGALGVKSCGMLIPLYLIRFDSSIPTEDNLSPARLAQHFNTSMRTVSYLGQGTSLFSTLL